MSATGLDVFDKTLQSTNIWLDEIMEDLGPDRRLAWHTLGAVLHALRDELPPDDSAHLSAQLPIMIRGAFYDQWRPSKVPARIRSRDEFLSRVHDELEQGRPVNAEDAVKSVTKTLSRHIDRGQAEKTRQLLPEDIRNLWVLQ